MKILVHYCRPSFTNCYLLGTDTGITATNSGFSGASSAGPEPGGGQLPPLDEKRTAILIDPGDMEQEILEQIESSDYWLQAVLVTHDHPSHVRGLKTLLRIYEFDIYAANQSILDRKTCVVKDGDLLTIGPFSIEVISAPGHSADSVVYRIDHFLFTGDVLGAGLTGSTASSYGAQLQMAAIRNKILSLPGDCVVLPGHGPPSSLEAERRFNAGVQLYEQNKNRRPKFAVDLD